jgi:hypothetical protein
MISTVSSAFALLNHQSPVNLPVSNLVPLLVRCVSLPCLNVFFFLAHLPSCPLAPMLPTRLIVIAIALHNTRQPCLNPTSRTFQIVTFPFAWAVLSVCITTVFHTLLFRVLSSAAHSLSPGPSFRSPPLVPCHHSSIISHILERAHLASCLDPSVILLFVVCSVLSWLLFLPWSFPQVIVQLFVVCRS